MTEFTASNGVEVRFVDTGIGQRMVLKDLDPAQTLLHRAEYIESWLDPRQWEAAREFFRDEEDKRLGRWRYTHEDGHVALVYPDAYDPDRFNVVVEETGRSVSLTRNQPAHQDWRSPLDAYFDAHPEPKPWHDAKPGELWVIRLSDSPEIGVSVEHFPPGVDVFQVPDGESISITRPSITAGRRIWPEVSS